MPSKFYMLHIHCSKETPNAQIEAILGDYDWVRLRGGNFYLIYAPDSAYVISHRLRSIIKDPDTHLVAEINIANHSGWVPKLAADWLEKPRSDQH